MKEIICAALIFAAGLFNCFGEMRTMKIELDGKKALSQENQKWRGMGMVSANNSSRLLVDYKWEHPEEYDEILNYIFGKDGLCINHLKIEMGSDINSSSGTEPAIMRTEDEIPDVTRGAGFILAADAKKINPDMSLDMLWWSEPKWVSSARNVYEARYKWYKANLCAAYEKFGLIFDFVSCNQNERSYDLKWIKFLSDSLKSDKDTPYDFSKIKIVGGEEVCTWHISDCMLSDEKLMSSIDVIGSHYTSWSTPETKILKMKNGKEVWFTEGSSPMKYAKGTYRFDKGNNGLSGINGGLDIAARIITACAEGSMTLYEFQPVINSYYDGVTYGCKQLITANEPWNGNYTLDTGYFVTKHFSSFLPKGWCIIESGCKGDGTAGGDGHAITGSKYNFLTACNPETGDFSTVICNATAQPIEYTFATENLKIGNLNLWETRGPDSIERPYDENYFKRIGSLENKNGNFTVTAKPFSILTITTIEKSESENERKHSLSNKSPVLALPYTDDFEYADYPENYLKERGNAPRYTTDEGGAFEVVSENNKNVLQQKITLKTKAKEWNRTPDPVTNLGDDRWYNYSASIDVKFEENNSVFSYAGIGIRYNLPDQGKNGWWLQLFADGKVALNKGKLSLYNTAISINEGWNNLKIAAFDNKVAIYVNGKLIAQKSAAEIKTSVPGAGRVAIYSSYDKNSFANLKVETIENFTPYISRFDDTDFCFNYSEGWNHSLMDSFKNYERTISTGNAEGKCYFSLDFEGTGFNITGLSEENSAVKISIDGKVTDKKIKIPATENREVMFSKTGLKQGKHQAKIEVITGEIKVDSAEIF